MFFITKRRLEIVGLCGHSISDEIVQDIQYGNNECQRYFGLSLPSELIERKRNKLVNSYNNVSSF